MKCRAFDAGPGDSQCPDKNLVYCLSRILRVGFYVGEIKRRMGD